MKHLLPVLGLLCLQPLTALRAEDLPRVKATEEKAIRALLGKKATVFGRVASTKETKTGMNFLDFEGGKFTVVSWKEDNAKFEGGSPAKLYAQKTIEVTGTIIEYHSKSAKPEEPGKLEIKLSSPDQVKIAKEGSGEGTDAKEKDAPDKKSGTEPKAPSGGEGAKEAKAGEPAPGPASPAPAAGESSNRVEARKFFK